MDIAFQNTSRELESRQATGMSLRVGLIVMSVVITLTLTTLTSLHFVYDDAFITLRYAANLAKHGELVWNLGERVEGITTFLLTIWLAGLIRVGVDPLIASQATGIAGGIMTVLGCLAVLQRYAPDVRATGLLVTAGSVPLLMWSFSGMEAAIIAALLVWTCWALLPLLAGDFRLPRLLLAGVLIAAAYLTRMDAAVPAATLVAAMCLVAPGPLSRRLTAGTIVAAILAVTIAIHLAWRVSYYGDWLPNTYYAKVGIDPHQRFEFGWRYALTTAFQAPGLMVATVLAPIAIFRGSHRRLATALFAAILSQVAYVTWAGGDHLPTGRFYVPIVGLAGVLLGLVVHALGSIGRWIVVTPLCIASVLAGLVAPHDSSISAETGRVVGKYVADHVPTDKVIALNTAGALPFYAQDHRFIDMLGLNDYHIARVTDLPHATEWQRRPGHAKGDGAYVLSRKPDIIIVRSALGTPIEESASLGEHELMASEEFARCYEFRSEPIVAPDDRWMQNEGLHTATWRYYERVCP